MFSTPALPAPVAIAAIEMIALPTDSSPGATTMPTTAVKIASDITRGFVKAMKCVVRLDRNTSAVRATRPSAIGIPSLLFGLTHLSASAPLRQFY
jgi:hypothetical protein